MTRNVALISTITALVALVGCSGSSTPSAAGGTAGAGAAGGSGVQIAQADVQQAPASSIAPAALSAAVAANNAFAVDLYGQVRLQTGASTGNLLTSPISASLALTMTYAGALDQTATEMASALHLDPNAGSAIFEGQNAISQALNARGASALMNATQYAQEGGQPAPSADDYQLQVVNSVWGEQTYTWEPAFLQTLAVDYGTGVYQQDFVHAFEPARTTINDWVSAHTNDKINDLLPKGALDTTTRMVLVNALHLKLPWADAFQPAATATATFARADSSAVSVSFMNRTSNMSYVDDGQAQIVALPLSNGELSVVITLPHADVELAAYEAALTPTSAALAPPATGALVELSLPKASFTSPSFSLASALKALGMNQAFDPHQANLSGLCGHPPDGSNLYVADVLQKAMVAMQETGVEAAAATAVIVAGDAAVVLPLPTPVPMVVNRPYLISIVDVPTGTVLMLGHIADPTNAGG